MGSSGNEYTPEALVEVERAYPVCSPFTVTLAPGTTALVPSVSVPRMVAVVRCANDGAAARRTRRQKTVLRMEGLRGRDTKVFEMSAASVTILSPGGGLSRAFRHRRREPHGPSRMPLGHGRASCDRGPLRALPRGSESVRGVGAEGHGDGRAHFRRLSGRREAAGLRIDREDLERIGALVPDDHPSPGGVDPEAARRLSTRRDVLHEGEAAGGAVAREHRDVVRPALGRVDEAAARVHEDLRAAVRGGWLRATG